MSSPPLKQADAPDFGPARAPFAEQTPLVLWYGSPASRWIDALALGNGRLGAMVFGGTGKERIGLNEDTLWSGGPYEPSREVESAVHAEIRRLMFAAHFEAAQNLSERLQGIPNSQASYQTLGEFQLNFPGHETPLDYRRDLDLNTAIATVTYRVGEVAHRREVFVSPVDQVLVVRITADRPRSINFTATYASPLDAEVSAEGNSVRMAGSNGDLLDRLTKAVLIPRALGCESRARVIAPGGKVSAREGTLVVENADSATLHVASATSYKRHDDVSGDPAALVSAALAALEDKPYELIKAAHVDAHRKLFGRVTLDLGRTPAADLPTDERVRNYLRHDDPALIALRFQFGRYLLLCSSRPGTQP